MKKYSGRNNLKPVILLGGGGHAKVVGDLLALLGAEVIGILTPDEKPGEVCFGIEVLGGDKTVKEYSPADIVLVNGIGQLPEKDIRNNVASKLRQQGYSFATLVHPGATIGSDVELAEGVQVMAGAVIQSGTRILQDTIINTGAIVDHDCRVGRNCHVAPGAVCCGQVCVSDNVFIGAGATITHNVTIGERSVVAAGATVYRDVLAELVYIEKNKTVKRN